MACLCLVYLLISLFACSRPGSGVSHVSLFCHSDEIKSDFLSFFSLFFFFFFLSLFSPGPGGAGGHNVSVCLRVESFFFFKSTALVNHATQLSSNVLTEFNFALGIARRPGLRGYYITPRITRLSRRRVALNSHWVN